MKFSLNRYSNIVQRVTAGVIGGGIIIASVCFNEWTFFSLFFIICLLSLFEFYRLISTTEVKPNKIVGIASGMFLYTLLFLAEKNGVDPKYLYLLFPFTFSLFLFELFQKNEKPFQNLAFTFLGIIYVALPFGLLNSSAFAFSSYHYEIILGTLFLIWANDIGGYFSGMLFGKTKLFPRVSPKKTWEGTIGGTVFTVVIGIVLSLFYSILSSTDWVIMALMIVVIGSCGDLVESLLKRSINIKDSGSIIPGHGGFLDRFDSLLLASPFIAAFIKLIA